MLWIKTYGTIVNQMAIGWLQPIRPYDMTVATFVAIQGPPEIDTVDPMVTNPKSCCFNSSFFWRKTPLIIHDVHLCSYGFLQRISTDPVKCPSIAMGKIGFSHEILEVFHHFGHQNRSDFWTDDPWVGSAFSF